MNQISLRRQLTLFLPPPIANPIDAVRRQYNPAQAALIGAHVTLCRDDEVTAWDDLKRRCVEMQFPAIQLHLGKPQRQDHWVYLPLAQGESAFHRLRQAVLADPNCRIHTPHVTLVHPRNGQCSESDFKSISNALDEGIVLFSEFAFIEQTEPHQPWQTVDTVSLAV